MSDASLQSEEEFEGQYSFLFHFVLFLKSTGEDADREGDLRCKSSNTEFVKMCQFQRADARQENSSNSN